MPFDSPATVSFVMLSGIPSSVKSDHATRREDDEVMNDESPPPSVTVPGVGGVKSKVTPLLQAATVLLSLICVT